MKRRSLILGLFSAPMAIIGLRSAVETKNSNRAADIAKLRAILVNQQMLNSYWIESGRFRFVRDRSISVVIGHGGAGGAAS